MIAFLIERLRHVNSANTIVMATTTNPLDDKLEEFCKIEKLSCFRGSEEDVLDRFYQCAKEYQADVIVRVTADCPLIDPAVVDEAVYHFLAEYPRYDFVSNVEKRTYPRGMDVEVFSFNSLQKAAKEANLPEEREHVTPYFYRHPELFHLGSIAGEIDNSRFRWTVDTEDDFRLISLILQNIYPSNPFFTLNDLLELFQKNPEWVNINAHVKQKEI